MGCRSTKPIPYAECVRTIARRIVTSKNVDPHDVARLLVFFDAPASLITRSTSTGYVRSNEYEWRSVALRLLNCRNENQISVMAPMLRPIYPFQTRSVRFTESP